ncbi:MAG TPA: hypothetical protein VIK52_06580 [Opitutaceae bacterium]
MNALLRSVWLIPTVAGFLASAVPCIAAEEDLGEHVGSIVVPQGFSSEEVQDAIVFAFGVRRWSLKEKTDTHVVGHIKQRSNEAILTLKFNASKIEMFCEGWKIDKDTGARRGTDLPHGWIKNIKEDVDDILKRRATQG